MITALDTNVLFDVLAVNSRFYPTSLAALTQARNDGTLVLCEPVFAELSSLLSAHGAVDDFLHQSDIQLVDSGTDVLWHAGVAWRSYAARRPDTTICARCGGSNDVRCASCGERIRYRQRVIADFIIGAHAMAHADQLLTRDRGYYRIYFPDLQLA